MFARCTLGGRGGRESGYINHYVTVCYSCMLIQRLWTVQPHTAGDASATSACAATALALSAAASPLVAVAISSPRDCIWLSVLPPLLRMATSESRRQSARTAHVTKAVTNNV